MIFNDFKCKNPDCLNIGFSLLYYVKRFDNDNSIVNFNCNNCPCIFVYDQKNERIYNYQWIIMSNKYKIQFHFDKIVIFDYIERIITKTFDENNSKNLKLAIKTIEMGNFI